MHIGWSLNEGIAILVPAVLFLLGSVRSQRGGRSAWFFTGAALLLGGLVLGSLGHALNGEAPAWSMVLAGGVALLVAGVVRAVRALGVRQDARRVEQAAPKDARGMSSGWWKLAVVVYMGAGIGSGAALAHGAIVLAPGLRYLLWGLWAMLLLAGVVTFSVSVTRARGSPVDAFTVIGTILVLLGGLVSMLIPGLPVDRFLAPGWVRYGPLPTKETLAVATPWLCWGALCGMLAGIYHAQGLVSLFLLGGMFLSAGVLGWGRYEGLFA